MDANLESQNTQQKPKSSKSTKENSYTLINLLQDIILFTIYIFLALLIVNLLLYMAEKQREDVEIQQRRNCRWPEEWCRNIWKCKRIRVRVENNQPRGVPALGNGEVTKSEADAEINRRFLLLNDIA